MGRSGEVPFFFIRHARANVVNDNTPPHDLLACSRTALARGSVTRGARPAHRGPEVFLWKALVAQRWREAQGVRPAVALKADQPWDRPADPDDRRWMREPRPPIWPS